MTDENKTNTKQVAVTELAEKAGVSRGTIYRRAKAYDIDLNSVLSAEQLEQLGVPVEQKQDTEREKELLHELNMLKTRVEQYETDIEQYKTDNEQLKQRAETDHQALLQEQSLHLMTQKRLEQSMESVKLLEDSTKKKKHWWQF